MYLILLKELREDRITSQKLQKAHPEINWQKFIESEEYKKFHKKFGDQFEKNEL